MRVSILVVLTSWARSSSPRIMASVSLARLPAGTPSRSCSRSLAPRSNSCECLWMRALTSPARSAGAGAVRPGAALGFDPSLACVAARRVRRSRACCSIQSWKTLASESSPTAAE